MATADQKQTSLRIEKSVEIKASAWQTFEALVVQLGPSSEMLDGTPMAMKFEAWPGGRWFRDLGNDSGHLWGHVQVIKPPTLIEINGPLFMSYPAISHVQYRVVEEGEMTILKLCHQAFGELDKGHCDNVGRCWKHQLEQVKSRAEKQES